MCCAGHMMSIVSIVSIVVVYRSMQSHSWISFLVLLLEF